MCLSTNPGGTVTKKVPILPGPESSDDMVNDTVVTNITDRSKQKEARGQFRDYRGRDKYRHFDEEAAVNPSGSDPSGTGTSTGPTHGRHSAKKRAAKAATKARMSARRASRNSSKGGD
tara:strand:+ start:314 stop:667 length:354 start_codon:yes stop_codon:yes gene_type:complete